MSSSAASNPPIQDATKYHCDSCFADCSGLRVSCAECPDFDACLHCFSSGVEIGSHKKNHNYCLMDNGTFNLIVEYWTADEELLLLDGIEQHGLGNWDDISDHVGTKSSQEVQSHFEEFYLWKNIGTMTLPQSSSDIKDHTTVDGETCPTSPGEVIDLPVSEQQELGYMPFRDDFEREYENDTEDLVKTLVCSRDDDELETALKLAMTDMYWRSLIERSRWKKVAHRYGLITAKHKLIASRRKYSREDREFKDKIRVFAQFLPSQQWEELVTNRIKEKELKCKIRDLIRYRRNGIKKLTACQEYEEHLVQRDKRKESRKRMQVISPPRMTKTSGNKKNHDDERRLGDRGASELGFLDKMKFESNRMLLSDKEKQFCTVLKLHFSRYLTMKTYLLNEYATRRIDGPFKCKPPAYMTSHLRGVLRDFFVQCGWME